MVHGNGNFYWCIQTNLTDVTVTPIFWTYVNSYTTGTYWNFGNGYFGTTAVSSAGTNSGVGTFEFDVPTWIQSIMHKKY